MSAPILFRAERYEMNRIRLPHSEIHGSQPVCGYPRLIAAYHVLHRLPVPRHPLHTLYILHCLIHFDGSRGNRNGTQARIFLKPFGLNFWLYVKLFSTLYIVVKEPQKIRNIYRLRMVGRTGLEPVTPALSRRCSNQLSYMPADHRWWRLGDSNS